jgi:AcrR family transcriptional regulator
MSQTRKTAQTREKDLRLAMFRIKRGRSHTGATRITVTSVAREVGVSAALIHNHYPTIAEAIREHQGRDSRAQRDAKHQALKQERERARELRREIASLRTDVQRLSSINEVLLAESAALRSRLGDQKVVALKSPKMVSRAPLAGEPGA